MSNDDLYKPKEGFSGISFEKDLNRFLVEKRIYCFVIVFAAEYFAFYKYGYKNSIN
jgi:hypothetical protein